MTDALAAIAHVLASGGWTILKYFGGIALAVIAFFIFVHLLRKFVEWMFRA